MTQDPQAGVPKGNWTEALGGENFSLTEAIGGVRGVLESLVPGLAFVITFVLTGSLGWTIGISAGASLLFCVVRLIQRTPLTQAFAGLVGVGIGIIWAATSGRAENYYAWGLLTNAGYALVLLISVLVRQPIAAWALKFLWSLPSGWMRQPEFSLLYRRSVIVTWVWVATFALRLAVQAPLYYGQQIAALGIMKLILGLPLFALAAWFTWVLLRELKPAAEIVAAEETQEDA